LIKPTEPPEEGSAIDKDPFEKEQKDGPQELPQVVKPYHADGPKNRSANLLDVKRAEFLFKDRPVDATHQTEQRMPRVQNLIQPGEEKITL
jgi:hypothetical protein